LPSHTLANPLGNQISLQRGWIWGKGTGDFTIHTPDLDVTLQSGAFALEYLPGETNGLYVREGQALVATGGQDMLTLDAGQMVIFGKGVTALVPVALDDAVVRALHLGEKSQVSIETDASFIARLTDAIEGLGVASFLAARVALLGIGILLFAGRGVIWRRRSPTP
jgi:hypothetical protein